MTVNLFRDRFGVKPLHYAAAQRLGEPEFVYGTTMRACRDQGADYASVRLAPPGSRIIYDDGEVTVERYYTPTLEPVPDDRETAAGRVRELLAESVDRFTDWHEEPCVLLSGGVDSSAITYLLAQHHPNLVAYTAVFDPDSADIKSAREVAAHLDIELVEVKIPLPTPGQLAEVVQTIEQPYKAQVEIGWASLQLADRIAADGFTVTYSGEGSDELWASHGFAYHERQRPNAPDWHEYRYRDLTKHAERSFPREYKAYGSRNIECRLPFAYQGLVEYALSLTEPVVCDNSWQCKRVLQDGFRDVLPKRAVTKQKRGFQDGLNIKRPIAEVVPGDPRVWYRETYRRIFGI